MSLKINDVKDDMKDLNRFLKDLFPDINPENENKLIEDGVLDSLDIFRLVTALEEEYKISIPFDEIIFENFNSKASIQSLMNKLSF
jgi:acyl carrier protein